MKSEAFERSPVFHDEVLINVDYGVWFSLQWRSLLGQPNDRICPRLAATGWLDINRMDASNCRHVKADPSDFAVSGLKLRGHGTRGEVMMRAAKMVYKSV
ncbi:MAG: hypothetical protein ACN6P2_06310 [Pseudomonas palmensis]|uniref:hypothetical protein n=1 Tax=Pseudomonas palmensis TaxID=2815362 RepID=UPI003D119684